MSFCLHEDCRAHAIEELMFMGRTFGVKRPDILAARNALMNTNARLAVKCRHVDARSRLQTETKFVQSWVGQRHLAEEA